MSGGATEPLWALETHLFLSAVLKKAFDVVLRLGRNATLLMLREEFPSLGGGASSAVGQLFQDVSLYILGSDARVDHMVMGFFSRLFPLAYRRLLGGGSSSSSSSSSSATGAASDECLREAWTKGPGGGVFGSYPKLLMTRLSRSLLATRVFLQALNLGIEVVNTTQHLRAGRECGRALLRLWYCPHCQGLVEGARLCPALCLGAMQGCLGGAGEVQPHWRSFVEGLGRLVEGMRGEQDVEAVTLSIPALVRSALRHTAANKNRISFVQMDVLQTRGGPSEEACRPAEPSRAEYAVEEATAGEGSGQEHHIRPGLRALGQGPGARGQGWG
ncbi:hypothetical protein ACEWY4_026680 [Coilia grayii]|uniref:Glypican-3 n=1 Tax=Coilia grayii TaxID=363190 RepID=A0ABD1ISG6_9TELE